MTVSCLIAFSEVTTIVIGAAPQSNVTTPPLASAVSSAASVQPSGAPLPTTAFDEVVSTAGIGSGHVGGGALTVPPVPVPVPVPVPPPDPVVPAPSPPPPHEIAAPAISRDPSAARGRRLRGAT
jgi:hypothetical protein